MKVIFFDNGNTAVFDEQGNQVPEMQESWLRLFLDYLEAEHREDPVELEITMPGGKRAKVFRTPNGLNWEILR